MTIALVNSFCAATYVRMYVYMYALQYEGINA